MISEWKKLLIRDCCVINPSSIKTNLPYKYIQYIDISSIGEGCQQEAFKIISRENAPSRAQRLVASGDCLISTVRPNRRSMIWIKTAEDNLVASTGFAVLRAKSAVILPRFLYYNLFSQSFTDYLVTREKGAAYPAVSITDIGDAEINLPSLPEQQAIIDILGSLDDRIALLRETNATLEAITQALFKSWFVDFDPVCAKQEGREPEGMDADAVALFPDRFEESELGLVPTGWRVSKFGDFITRLSVGKKYDNKTALQEGNVPILDQGKSGVIGFHNDIPSVKASLDAPVIVFANHTCYMRLISFDFSAIQNVLPFIGKEVDTVWAYHATKDRVSFSEYKGHWPDFVIEKTVVPDILLTLAFRKTVDPLIRRIRLNELQYQNLAFIRDTLLPRLISGQLRLPDIEIDMEVIR